MKKLALFFVVYLIHICNSYSDWISDSRSNCSIWTPNSGANSRSDRIEWNGQCSDGKATGRGLLKWYRNDGVLAQYEGEYLNGKMNGAGILAFDSHGRRYEGQFRDNSEHGFGTIFITKGKGSDPGSRLESFGEWIGNEFVAQGIWNEGEIILKCKNDSDCKSKMEHKKEEENKIARDEVARNAIRHEHSCDNYYPGRVGKIKTNAFLATEDGFIVRYINKDRKMVTIEGTSGGNSIKYGETRELSCDSLLDWEI